MTTEKILKKIESDNERKRLRLLKNTQNKKRFNKKGIQMWKR
jgi:hypothetical protein